MKFIVTGDMLMVPDLKGIKTKDGKGNESRPHPNHIPKGHFIELGNADNIKDIAESETRIFQLISTLTMAGKIAPASEENVKRCNEEVAAEAKKQARANALNAQAAGAQLLAAKAAAAEAAA